MVPSTPLESISPSQNIFLHPDPNINHIPESELPCRLHRLRDSTTRLPHSLVQSTLRPAEHCVLSLRSCSGLGQTLGLRLARPEPVPRDQRSEAIVLGRNVRKFWAAIARLRWIEDQGTLLTLLRPLLITRRAGVHLPARTTGQHKLRTPTAGWRWASSSSYRTGR
ncbi:hypothetical protein RRG08_020586 [Elysia crispata]|uniref:Uncharacterized protein n=1 Tax=Elysia crispata TaxID=231223 RepID=A0AAE1A634_9GAST|nr:hypothetical protein RRG08_020586 [Elysia crispata]